MNVRRGFAVVALVGSALSVGCVEASAEIPDLEVTRQNVQIQAVPAELPEGTEVTLVQQFKYEKSTSPLPDALTSNMRATGVTITLRKGAADLSFVHAAKLTVAANDEAPETVIDYQLDASDSVGDSLTLPLVKTPAALNPWTVDSSSFELSVTGVLPREAWTIDVTLSYTGSISYHP